MPSGFAAPLSRPVVVRAAAIVLALAMVYYLSSHLGTFWLTGGRASSPIFPGTGAALAALVLAGRGYWPAVLVGRLVAFVISGSSQPFGVWLAVAAGNALAAWAGAYALDRFGRLDVGLSRLRDVLWLGMAGALGSSVVGATVGSVALTLAGGALAVPFTTSWTTWWMGSVGGILVITPLALAWGTGDPLPRKPTYWLHLLACVVTTSVVSALVFFGPASALARTWLVFPVLLWCSLAFGVRGATLALLPATVIGVAGTSSGAGVLAASPVIDVRYIVLQQFIIAASFTALVLAVVADERRGKLALRDREHRLHLALAAARSFAFEYDPETDRVTRTSECADILGLPTDAVSGPPDALVSRVDEADRSQFAAAQAAASPERPTYRVAYRFNRPDGRTVFLEETCTCAFADDGRLTRVVGVAVDVTERRHAEIERESLLGRERTARQEAERATLVRDEFLGTVSHELRTPLNAILGWAQILQSGPRTADALQSGLATIARNARLQTQLIDDLLDLSRMSAGQLRIAAQPVDLATVVQDAVLAVTPAAEAKGLHLHHDSTQTGLYVSGDADRLQQVCWNLLVNAVKFTPSGGHIHVVLHRDEGQYVVVVSDSGQGIRIDFLPYVFDRFRQGDGSTTRRHSGLGIGLALVRQLVELHGGTVTAESRGGGLGSTFSVRLPAHQALASLETATPLAPQPSDGGPGAASLTVLVVDDDADSRDVAVRFLEASGARVVTAAGADEGLQVLQAERPDVLIADIGMPGVDGYALIRAVRALRPDQGAGTPAAAVTALARDDDRQRAFDAGYEAHLPKPITRDALIATVSRLHRSRNPA